MTNDTTTLNGALMELGKTMAENLNEKGVSANANNGLTTLAGKILDVEPSINGLELSTNIDINASSNEIFKDEQVIFTALLSASYDDETVTDVDLSGVLTGATVQFKIGNTVIGTGVTDNNGIATYTHTFDSFGNYDVVAVFAGTENFDAVSSSAVSITVAYDLDIVSDNDILSSYDGDVATITATLKDNGVVVSGETLSYEIKHGQTTIDTGTYTTDNNGQISISYTGTGVGDVSVIISYGSLLQERYEILDTKWYATDSDVMQWNTSSSGINTNYNSDRVINTGETLYIKLQNIPTSVVVGAVDGTGYCQLMKDNNQLKLYWTGSSENETGSLTTDTLMKLEIVSSNAQNWYINDTLLKQITNHTLSSPKAMIRKYMDYPVTVDIMYII